jgi:hypothetical protein
VNSYVDYAAVGILEKKRNGLFTLDRESGAAHYANTLSGQGKSPPEISLSLPPHRYAVLYFTFSLEKE